MRIVALVVLSLIGSTIALGDTPFKGAVTDATDAPISGAMILIHWDSAGSTVGLTTNVGIKEDLVIRTKGDGAFKVDLPPGFYDVFVAAMAFSPTCRKIRIKPGEGLEVTLRRRPTLHGGDGGQDRASKQHLSPLSPLNSSDCT